MTTMGPVQSTSPSDCLSCPAAVGAAVFLAEKETERFAAFERKASLDERAQELQAQLNDTLLGNFHKECKARVAVMQRLGFLGEDGTVLLKGRAAGEVDTTDELLATGKGENGFAGGGAGKGGMKGWEVCFCRHGRWMAGQVLVTEGVVVGGEARQRGEALVRWTQRMSYWHW